jgi:glycosyltransferase involved in cell wall biosynthesis
MTSLPGEAARRDLVFVDDAPIMGGAEVFGLRVAAWASSNRPSFRVHYVCPGDSVLAGRAREAGLAVTAFTFPDLLITRTPQIAVAVGRLRRLLRSFDERAVLVGITARTQAYLVAATRLRRRPPAVVHVLLEQETAARVSARVVFRHFGVPVAVGANARRTYQELLGGRPLAAVNNVYDPSQLARLAAHRDRPTGAGTARLGVLARLIPMKGVLELVEELSEVPDAWSQLTVGAPRQDEAYAVRLERRIRELGLDERVRLAGDIGDIAEFFEGIDVLVVPSTGVEGQPTVIMEAMAAGRPVVVRRHVWSTDFEGLPVLPYDDSAGLARALETVSREPAAVDEIERRFGPAQALDGVVAAADTASSRA